MTWRDSDTNDDQWKLSIKVQRKKQTFSIFLPLWNVYNVVSSEENIEQTAVGARGPMGPWFDLLVVRMRSEQIWEETSLWAMWRRQTQQMTGYVSSTGAPSCSVGNASRGSFLCCGWKRPVGRNTIVQRQWSVWKVLLLAFWMTNGHYEILIPFELRLC